MYRELHFALSPTPLPSGGATANQLPGRVLEGLWCAGHDPQLAGGSPTCRGLPEEIAASLHTWEANW